MEKETTTRGWSTAEPTSIEFAHTFRGLLQHALGVLGDKRKLLIVLDNLDRLPSEEAMRAFATLRGLFEKDAQDTAWRSQLWLVVPYDPLILRGAPEILGDGQALSTQADSADVGEQSPEAAFRDKFFQARFRLAPPVVLRWREFLQSCLKAALPDHEACVESVCDLFELTRDRNRALPPGGSVQGGNPIPTPREIKQFVNRLATIHMQWPCATSGGKNGNSLASEAEPIPLALQAGFALCEGRVVTGELSDYVPGSAQGEFFSREELRLIVTATAAGGRKVAGWERHIAAMWYGVPQQAALHMLFWPRIHEAYTWGITRDGRAGAELPYELLLPSRSVDGFWEIARAVARVQIGRPDARALAKCSTTLAVLAKWRNDSTGWRETWRQIEADVIAT